MIVLHQIPKLRSTIAKVVGAGILVFVFLLFQVPGIGCPEFKCVYRAAATCSGQQSTQNDPFGVVIWALVHRPLWSGGAGEACSGTSS